ncbi:MAG: PAS domain S-box protein, partial [Anaerolineae bacterium]|nr:PAS domain S-box protein [Anaerolineae bacterium]
QTKVQMRRCEETIAERTAELQAANRELQDEITDRQRVEMELLLKAQLLDSVTDSIFVYDLDGNLTYVNEAAYRSRGYTRSELLALRPRELTAPPYRDRHEAWVRQVLERGEITYESADLRKDGSVMPVEVHARTVVSDGQKLILSVARDVTERRRLEDQLHHAQRMETVGRLAGGIAHDFNNILTAITGYASFAHNALRPGDPARDDIAQVLQGAERAASLVRQLLAFSRRQVTAPRPTNLNQVVLNLEKMLRRVIGEDIELVTVPAPNLGTVRVDPGQIEQVLTNLAVNGRDAMAAGGQLVIETANVRLDEEYARQHVSVTPGDYVMVAVSDTGCGMSDEVKGRVFEPYFTTKAPGKGTGLGLATCYGIVKQNGGHIWFYSEVGKGTTFKVYFPRIEEAPMEVSPREREPDTERRARTVLLAEDEPAVRSFAARVLRQAGYCVLEAANGQHALELAAGRDGDMVDLLLTDLVMPQMSGVELHRRLRASYPGLKTLFMSGYTDDVASYQNLPTDGVAYLQKPFTAASLSGEVQELLSCR